MPLDKRFPGSGWNLALLARRWLPWVYGGLLAGCLCGQTLVASAAVTLDSASASYGTAVSSLTWSHTVSGNNRLLILGASIRGNVAISSATYAGQALTFLRADYYTGTPDIRCEMWYLQNPTTGTNNVIVTLASAQSIVAGVSSWDNVNIATPLGTSAGAVHNGTASSTATLTLSTTAGQLVVDTAVTQFSGATLVPDASQTQRWNRQGLNNNGACSSKLAVSSSTTMTWTLSMAEYWVLCAVPVNEEPFTPTSTRTSTRTATPTATPSVTRTGTPTATPTITRTSTRTATRTVTPSVTKTSTPTRTWTRTWTPTQTVTPTSTVSPTISATSTITPYYSPTLTATPIIIPVTEVVAYPQPAHDQIWFAFPSQDAAVVRVEVFNLLGEKVKEWEIQQPLENRLFWDIRQTAPGVYLVRLSVSDSSGQTTRYPFKKIAIVH